MTNAAVLFAGAQMDPLYDTLGEQAAAALIGAATTLLREKVAAGGGRTMKTIGDEVFALFPDVASAAGAAVAMQRGMLALGSAWPGGSRLQVGFTWGPVVERDGDVFGDTVSFAARAAALAGAGRIVLLGEARAQLSLDQRQACRLAHRVSAKGRAYSFEYFELPWA